MPGGVSNLLPLVTDAQVRLVRITPDINESVLSPLYGNEDGPPLSFLISLLQQPSCSAWMLSEGEEICAAVWYQQAVDEAELLDVRVQEHQRRRGLGRQLVWASMAALALQEVMQIRLEVRVSNHAAIALYRNLGFRECGRRRDYYPCEEGREDAILMVLELNRGGVES